MDKPAPLPPANTRDTFLGFDYGIKKIGMAVGQLATRTTSPLKTIRAIRQKPDWPVIAGLIAEWQPAGLIVGFSRQADGSDNPVTPKIIKFCRQLEGRFLLPVYTVDEQLTTFAAKQMLYDDLGARADKLWAVQDQLAAQLILQTWLNEQP